MAGVDWQAAIHYAKLVAIAYQVEPGDPYTADILARIQQSGYEFIAPLYGNDLSNDFDKHVGDEVTYGFLAKSAAGELVAAIRGTEGILEWIHDAAFLFVPNPVHPGGGFTEDGFSAIYRSLRGGADPNSSTAIDTIATIVGGGGITSVTITGHSLGAAVATLLALDVGLNVTNKALTAYTFASPLVGEAIFEHTYNSVVQDTLRIHNRSDIVPKLPPFPYRHVGNDIELVAPNGEVTASIACAHILDTYLWLMDQQDGGANQLKLDNDCRGTAYPGPV